MSELDLESDSFFLSLCLLSFIPPPLLPSHLLTFRLFSFHSFPSLPPSFPFFSPSLPSFPLFASSPTLLLVPLLLSRALYYVGMNIFKKFDLCEVLNVEDTVLASWLKVSTFYLVSMQTW